MKDYTNELAWAMYFSNIRAMGHHPGNLKLETDYKLAIQRAAREADEMLLQHQKRWPK